MTVYLIFCDEFYHYFTISLHLPNIYLNVCNVNSFVNNISVIFSVMFYTINKTLRNHNNRRIQFLVTSLFDKKPPILHKIMMAVNYTCIANTQMSAKYTDPGSDN